MRRYCIVIALLLLSVNVFAANTFLALCYHDVRDDVDGTVDDDQMAVSTDNLIAQFSWLRQHGYHVISLDDVRAARRGEKSLPDKAILLTFDDGYKSTFTHVFPLLKQFNYPAVVALVGRWLDTPRGQNVQYGDKEIRPRRFFMDWDEIKIMAKSGLVEFASHTYDLHKGILGNPFGNFQPAVTTLRYDKDRHHYETTAQHRTMLRQDLRRNNLLFKEKTGLTLKAMVWPYGEYNQMAEEVAHAQGLAMSLTLDDGINTISKENTRIKRLLIKGNPSLADFVYDLQHPVSQDPVRVAHVDLDYIYDPDPVQQNKNLSQLLDRIKAMKINTVYLQAFSDPDGDGNADALYFPNRYLPVKADLFNRVAWQLRSRCQVKVYAWMPVLSFLIPGTRSLRVRVMDNDGTIKAVDSDYVRLSPFSEKARKMIESIYQDLAKHAHFDGLLFHDDAYLGEDEDLSPDAMLAAQRGLNKKQFSPEDLRHRYLTQWIQLKTRTLTALTQKLAETVRYYRPQVKTARNIYANVILNPRSQRWFSQNFQDMLDNYDYTAVMAMPYMEQARKPRHWLAQLVGKVKQYDPTLNKTVFELQAVDWRIKQPVSAVKLRDQFRLLMRNGVKHIGYYPDMFLDNEPRLAMLKASISLSIFPFEQ